MKANPVWRRKTILRALLLFAASAIIAGVVSTSGMVRDLGSFRASVLTGSADGAYHALATRLAERAKRDGKRLDVVATEGSIQNVSRLIAGRGACVDKFAFIQDGTPVPSDAGLELLGRLPEPESLLLLGRRDHPVASIADLRGASVGVGPEGSGTAYLMRRLFADPDLAGLDIRMSYHALEDQAQLVSQGSLDLAAYVMRDDAEFLRAVIRKYELDIADLQGLQGLVGRHSWLSLGRVPEGRYDLVHRIPPHEKIVPQINTLVVASPCARRSSRIELLMLLSTELPRFVRSNPPSSTSSATVAPLSPEARQFFLTGEPEFADRYFPWLVNIMSPAYWIYFAMAATALFNALKGLSRFRLWRIDAAREELEAEVRQIAGDVVSYAPTPDLSTRELRVDQEGQAMAQDILDQLARLRSRCQHHAKAFSTPMGDEMLFRYQQSLIDQTTVILKALVSGGVPRS
nr:TAXI family TRAP transporter solute-binding subunit [Bradyrhizobium sp.]